MLYVFGTFTGNADDIRHWLYPYLLLWPWQCPFLSILGLAEAFLEAKRPPRAESSPERSGLLEYMNMTHDEWEAQSQKNL